MDQLKNIIENLPENEWITVHDFSENYRCTDKSWNSTPREPRGIEMGPRASSAWRGVRRLCGMYKYTTNPSCGWDVNKTEVPCWEIATLSAR
jgi:hypothetical protein